MSGLYKHLITYGRSKACPLHMPGHKRNGDVFSFENPFSFDITEIDGFDNLHHPEGILKEAMDEAAKEYGAERTYFLINGSSGGILSAISACVKPGGKILVARNCHKSVFHGIFLRNLTPVYLMPEMIEGWGASGEISPEQVKKALMEQSDIQAVLITSPTYEGVCSDIRKISEIVHEYKIPLIVDGAHGAHFHFWTNRSYPAAALESGADLVIESLHKTLPSLTQTAVLHKKSELVEEELLSYYLQIYQTSSPSYVLMASIDSCISYMGSDEGKLAMKVYEERLEGLRRELGELSHLELLSDRELHSDREAYSGRHRGNYDISKLVIKSPYLSGVELYDLLRITYEIQPEMCTETYVILMTSPGDSPEVFHRVRDALVDIDATIGKECGKELPKCETAGSEIAVEDEAAEIHEGIEERKFAGKLEAAQAALPEPVVVMSPAKASEMSGTATEMPISRSEGYVAAEFVYLYPPGIPILVPGERITEDVVRVIDIYKAHGLKLQGMKDMTGEKIRVFEKIKEDLR